MRFPLEAVVIMYGAVKDELVAADGPEHFAKVVADAARRARRFGWPVLVHDHLRGPRTKCNGRRCQLVFYNNYGVVVS